MPIQTASAPSQSPTGRTREWHDVDLAMFRNEIMPLDRPAVLRGLVADWPATAAGRRSPQAFCDYIGRLDVGRPMQTAVGPASIKGRLFYRDDMQGFNFERVNETFRIALGRILAHMDQAEPPAVYAGALVTAECFPGFDGENPMPLLGPTAPSRIWASSPVTAPTHYDMSDNIACVVAGRRRFTFFPPEQLPNLYVGPLEMTPAGQPTSLVKVGEADFDLYPRFAEALAAGETVDLEPGDAVFIPNLWWHNVQSLEPFNILVNYWWNDAGRGAASPFAALLHTIMAVSALPQNRREAWLRMFAHLAFQADGPPAEHLATEHRGVMGGLTPPMAAQLKQWLAHGLQRP